MAVKNGRGLATGTNREIQRFAGRRTQVVDAAAGTVLPGINDSHLHFNAVGFQVPPFSYPVDTATPGAWIWGGGWNDNRLPGRPDRRASTR